MPSLRYPWPAADRLASVRRRLSRSIYHHRRPAVFMTPNSNSFSIIGTHITTRNCTDKSKSASLPIHSHFLDSTVYQHHADIQPRLSSWALCPPCAFGDSFASLYGVNVALKNDKDQDDSFSCNNRRPFTPMLATTLVSVISSFLVVFG